MTGSTKIHWTDDEELVSKFVLRQLSSGEEAHLTEHLNTCGHCQKSVNRESLIAAGTKLAAREELKHRLQSRLVFDDQHAVVSASKAKGHGVPWMRIAGLAAAAVIIVVVGVYNNWFSTDYRRTPPIPENVAQEQPKVESMQKSQEAKQRRTETAHGPLQGKDLAQSSAGVGAESSKDGKGSKTKPRESGKSKERTPERISEQNIAGEPAAGADKRTGTIEEMKSETETRLTDQAMVPPPQAYWVEGHIIAYTATSDEQSQNRLPRSDARGNALHIQGGQKTAKMELEGQHISEPSTTIANLSLTQKPSSSLPPALQHRRVRSGTVQTFIENRADSIQMTLYLDSLVSESSLSSENVETIGSDSLILHLPNQRIGLRLPSALVGQVNSKTNR